MKLSTQADYLPVREYMKMLQELSLKETGRPPNWVEVMPKHYPRVRLKNEHWTVAHQWCNTVCGEENYCWSGNNFFFNNEKDAQMFQLCFGEYHVAV
jgi:hypothetical protein